jgi:hypothetical protein
MAIALHSVANSGDTQQICPVAQSEALWHPSVLGPPSPVPLLASLPVPLLASLLVPLIAPVSPPPSSSEAGFIELVEAHATAIAIAPPAPKSQTIGLFIRRASS